MIRPPALRRGDVVRVVAPGSPFDPEPFERGLSVLRDRLGLVPRMREDVRARAGYLAGDDARRLGEWLEAASDPEARAVWCARGGYGAMRILPRLEAARLLHPPKVVVGFSDITALHAALNRAGLVTVHGPVVTQLGSLAPAALDHLEALLLGPPAGAPGAGLPAPGSGVPAAATVRPGRVTGPLMGGNLRILASLCGTPWQARLAGAVLFLEDVGEPPYRLDRAFTQLELSGALDGVAGVCLGAFSECGDGGAGAETVRRLAGGLGVPAVEGIPAGHQADNRALPLGSLVTLVAPGEGGQGPPRLLFDQGAVA